MEGELRVVRGEAGKVAAFEAEINGLQHSNADLASKASRSAAQVTELEEKVRRSEHALERAKIELQELADLRRQLRRSEAKAELAETRDATIRALRSEIDELRANLRAAEAVSASAVKAAKKAKKIKKAKKEKSKKSKKSKVSAASWQVGATELGTPGANHTDDLKLISGIGPVMERTLQSIGIKTWEQIADFTETDIAKVNDAIEAFPGRIERDDWVGGAKALLAQGHDPHVDTTQPTNEPTAASQAKAADAPAPAPQLVTEVRGPASPAPDSPAPDSAKTPQATEARATDDAGRTLVRVWQAGRTPLGTPGARHSDDLKVVNGIGPVLESTLNGYGIRSWEQLAALTDAEVSTVNDALKFPGRIERDQWIAQAKELTRRFPLTEPYHRPTRKTFLNTSSDTDPGS